MNNDNSNNNSMAMLDPCKSSTTLWTLSQVVGKLRAWVDVDCCCMICRFTGSAECDELAAGRDSEVSRHVPRDQETDLPTLLLHLQWRPTGDPRPVQEPDGDTSAPQEMLWQHQESQHDQGKFSICTPSVTHWCSEQKRNLEMWQVICVPRPPM